jgi:hypothetical protein
MTAFVAPFPLHFGARVVDALLQVWAAPGARAADEWRGEHTASPLSLDWRLLPPLTVGPVVPSPPPPPLPQSCDPAVLLRVALALMEALQPELLELGDFEALISAIKVGLGGWGVGGVGGWGVGGRGGGAAWLEAGMPAAAALGQAPPGPSRRPRPSRIPFAPAPRPHPASRSTRCSGPSPPSAASSTTH